MEFKDPRTVSIKDIKQKIKLDSLNDDFLVTDNIDEVRLLYSGYPVKIDGLVIGLCTSGEATISIGMEKFKLGKNSLALVLPEQITQMHSRSDDYDSMLMIFARNRLDNIRINIQSVIPAFINVKDNPVRVLGCEDQELINEYVSFIRKRMQENTLGGKTESIRLLLMSLFLEIGSLYKIPVDMQKSKARKDVIFEQFHKLVTKDFKEHRSVRFYADKLCITPKHLSFVVKNVTGKTAAEWIDGYIILESMTLLKFSDMTVKQVSNILNFPNQSFFSKFFKRHTGMSPSEYIVR